MRSRSVVALACAAGATLTATACAPTSGGTSTQPITPTGSARPAASMCDSSSLTSSGIAPRDIRRGPEEYEQFGRTYITVVVSMKVTVPCTGGNWQIEMAPAGGEWKSVGHFGPAGPFGPYPTGELLTFWLSWPEPVDQRPTVDAHVQINGFDIAVEAPQWSQPDTAWAGPVLGEPTFSFSPTP